MNYLTNEVSIVSMESPTEANAVEPVKLLWQMSVAIKRQGSSGRFDINFRIRDYSIVINFFIYLGKLLGPHIFLSGMGVKRLK